MLEQRHRQLLDLTPIKRNITLPSRISQEEIKKRYREEAIMSGAKSGVEPGQYTILATTADESGAIRSATASVNVTEGETATVSLTLPN